MSDAEKTFWIFLVLLILGVCFMGLSMATGAADRIQEDGRYSERMAEGLLLFVGAAGLVLVILWGLSRP